MRVQTFSRSLIYLMVLVAAGCMIGGRTQGSDRVDGSPCYVTGNGNLEIEACATDVKDPLAVSGTVYRFRSRIAGEEWREVFSIRHDDPIPIPSQNIRFVGSKCAYVFFAWAFAVTTDNGVSWSVWDAHNDETLRAGINYGMIVDVRLDESGSGRMQLGGLSASRLGIDSMVTYDYGRSWSR